MLFGACASCALDTDQPQGFHGATEGVADFLTVLFRQPQHAINSVVLGYPQYLLVSLFTVVDSWSPVPVGEIETIAPGWRKGMTRF